MVGKKHPAPPSVPHPKRRRVLRPGLAPIVEAGRGDVGVPKPFMHLGNVGFVRQGIGGSRGPH